MERRIITTTLLSLLLHTPLLMGIMAATAPSLHSVQRRENFTMEFTLASLPGSPAGHQERRVRQSPSHPIPPPSPPQPTDRGRAPEHFHNTPGGSAGDGAAKPAPENGADHLPISTDSGKKGALPELPTAAAATPNRIDMGGHLPKGTRGEPLETRMGDPGSPRFLKRVEPAYPPMARRMGREGKVLLRLTIDERGKLESVEVMEGGGFGFTEAAVEAMERSVFAPAMESGRAVKSRVLVPVRFVLKDGP